jgi:hypothetical protein
VDMSARVRGAKENLNVSAGKYSGMKHLEMMSEQEKKDLVQFLKSL